MFKAINLRKIREGFGFFSSCKVDDEIDFYDEVVENIYDYLGYEENPEELFMNEGINEVLKYKDYKKVSFFKKNSN